MVAQKGEVEAGFAHRTIGSPSEMGLLDEAVQTRARLVLHPKEMNVDDRDILKSSYGNRGLCLLIDKLLACRYDQT